MTQLLGVCCFRRIKNAWHKILCVWKRPNEEVVLKNDVPQLLNQALQDKMSFSVDQIFLNQPKEMISDKYAETNATLALLEIFKGVRRGKGSSAVNGKQKILNIELRRSVSDEII